ncbi:Olfactory receptor 14I1 [Manis javanica]|nr:Olfactory receptor 14I1 [Manis javanica]
MLADTDNLTIFTEFLLMDVSSSRELQILQGLFASLGPVSNSSSIQTLLTAMFYSMVSPLVNPIIFSLRNREIKSAVHRMLKKAFQFHRSDFIS